MSKGKSHRVCVAVGIKADISQSQVQLIAASVVVLLHIRACLTPVLRLLALVHHPIINRNHSP